MKGSVYLIPTYLSKSNNASFLAPMVLDVIKHTTYFLVENVRTTRRFISSLQLDIDISGLKFEVVDKKTTETEVSRLAEPVLNGQNIGIVSEAGLPGLADPGNLIISWAHKNDVKVIPLPGATSIQTAVITSGFSGQQYTFHGYLPIQKNERAKAIKNLDQTVHKTGFTQVFMETPFRNNQLFEDLLKHLQPGTFLHVATDLFGEKQLVKTLSVEAWKKWSIDLHKIPTVYCLGQITR